MSNQHTVDISLSRLYQKIWGTDSAAFDPKVTKSEGNTELSRVNYGTAGGSPYYKIDPVLGQEYFLPITVTYPDPLNQDTSGLGSTPGSGGRVGSLSGGSTGILKSWDLPFPILQISSRKIIIETPMTERRGSVKQLINMDDYEIRVRGFIIANSNDFPEKDVANLRELYECNSAISIKNPITDIFLLRPDRGGSDKVVIKMMNLPEVKGIKNVRGYELVMVSDAPFSLYEIE